LKLSPATYRVQFDFYFYVKEQKGLFPKKREKDKLRHLTANADSVYVASFPFILHPKASFGMSLRGDFLFFQRTERGALLLDNDNFDEYQPARLSGVTTAVVCFARELSHFSTLAVIKEQSANAHNFIQAE